jgi:hypothetical protein
MQLQYGSNVIDADYSASYYDALVTLNARKLPLWWCIACPAVAGTAVPIILNCAAYLLGLAICRILHLSKTTQTIVLCALHSKVYACDVFDIRSFCSCTLMLLCCLACEEVA